MPLIFMMVKASHNSPQVHEAKFSTNSAPRQIALGKNSKRIVCRICNKLRKQIFLPMSKHHQARNLRLAFSNISVADLFRKSNQQSLSTFMQHLAKRICLFPLQPKLWPVNA